MERSEFRRLRRRQLLEMILGQIEENETLSEENETLKHRLEDLEAELASKKIEIEKAGTLAEASMKMNGVFVAADAAAQCLLDNIRDREEQTRLACEEMEEEAKKASAVIIQNAEKEAAQMKEDADLFRRKAHEDSEKYWADVDARVRELLSKHEELNTLFGSRIGVA